MGAGKSGFFTGTRGSEQRLTKHGEQRLKERGFSEKDIIKTKSTTTILTQKDGAKVYVYETSSGRYNVIVEGANGIITALKNISEKALERLKNNYEWE